MRTALEQALPSFIVSMVVRHARHGDGIAANVEPGCRA